jgi:hypothetical protein
MKMGCEVLFSAWLVTLPDCHHHAVRRMLYHLSNKHAGRSRRALLSSLSATLQTTLVMMKMPLRQAEDLSSATREHDDRSLSVQ